ncbi:MAG: hypothetical protein COA82_10770 [Alkaliphilus sp.]|nr:ribbon-helix-helix protein, CopG family [Alkaliphilus sp. AH-315-G20]MBN4074765.1 ribbon-helix-helix protein, CopG family [bacterium AH-315-E09]PHS30925.1 MAG: hypothetical protein COA82_10770 [Alkaliphilus sp.]
MSDIVRTTLRIPKELLKKIKLIALNEEKNQNAIILEAIEEFIKNKKRRDINVL